MGGAVVWGLFSRGLNMKMELTFELAKGVSPNVLIRGADQYPREPARMYQRRAITV